MSQKRHKTAGLILAAGMSTRMGRPKQLLRIGGHTLLDHILKETLKSDLDRVILVLGHRSEDIRTALKTDPDHEKLEIVENARYREGISSSIIAGLRVVEDIYDHVMIILADMPHITAHLINHFLYHFLLSGLPLGAVKIGERRSHPVIFGKDFYVALHLMTGDMGGRSIFTENPGRVCLVEADEIYDDTDIDTIDDYRRFKRM